MYKFKKTHEKLNKPKVCNAKIQLVIRVKPTNNLSTFKCNNVHDKYHFKRTKLCIDFSKFNTRENKVFHTHTNKNRVGYIWKTQTTEGNAPQWQSGNKIVIKASLNFFLSFRFKLKFFFLCLANVYFCCDCI